MKKSVVISIVDDDDIYRYSVLRTLKEQNITKKILVFSDGEEALDFMLDNIGNSQNLPDVIFLDINMPIMDGFQFMEEYIKIKPKVGKKITVYMISSSVNPIDIERSKSISEISDYIIKPIETEKLVAIIKEIETSS